MLPDEIKKKGKQAYTQFKRDPWYPSLHFKRVHSRLPIYSVRITKDYRAVSVL
ncbi:ParE family toxin-like protein [Desulfosarcina sp. BuS5]|uniref:ParE family toxin-like protein n=1 Tax=Desulfosarcina sp. BuS5 TaxID=933262 RepID=UPI003FCD090F